MEKLAVKVQCTKCEKTWTPSTVIDADEWRCASCNGKVVAIPVAQKKVHHTDIESLIEWLEYRKTTGQRAARDDADQEEHWAGLVRALQQKLKIVEEVAGLKPDWDECFECGESVGKPGHIVDGKLTCR